MSAQPSTATINNVTSVTFSVNTSSLVVYSICTVVHKTHPIISWITQSTRNPAIAEGPRDAGVPVEIW